MSRYGVYGNVIAPTNASGSTLSHRENRTPANSTVPLASTSALIPNGLVNGRSPSPFTPPSSSNKDQSAYANHRTAEDLESQNDEQLEGLSAKVKMLKDITIGIGNEVRDSTKLLSGMNDNFSETQGLLGGTFSRMRKMAKNQGSRWFYWLMFLILVFWIFVLRWIGIL